MTRAISATSRFCEMYYIWGSQDSGKDTKVKMLHAFLGHGKDNYGVQLPGNYVMQQTRYLTAKDGPAPYHARTLGKRLAWASEVPKHYSLADDFIKPFCDMEGAPVCSRKLNKGCRDFMPTALLVATSNHPLRVTRPDGLRRLRVCQTTVSFTLKPSMATEERAEDPDKPRRVQQVHLLPCGKSRGLVGDGVQPRHRDQAAATGDEDERHGPGPKQNERMVGVKLRSASSS